MADESYNPMRLTTRSIRKMIVGLDTPVRLDNNRRVIAINFDNAATTPPFRKVAQRIQHELLYYGSVGRGKGQKSEHTSKVYAEGRSIIKDFVGAQSDLYTVFYASNTTDGMNKLASALIESPADIVLSTRMEHHANDLPWRERATVVYAEVDSNGRLVMADFERLLAAHDVKYVTVTAASNVTGYTNDVHAIAKIAHRHGAKIIVDGAQIIAHRAFQMLGQTPEENIDFLVFSAHKMYAPYGGGAVVGLTEVLNQHTPKFYGGGMVEGVCDESVRYTAAPDRYEAGSPNYPGVVGMLEAVRMLRRMGFYRIHAHEQRLMRRLLRGLGRMPGVTVYGDNDNIDDRVGTVVFKLSGITPENTANMLAGYYGIAVRHGAFCAHPYVRRLTGEEQAQECAAPEGMVRISFGIYNDEREVDCLLRAISEMLYRGIPGEFAGYERACVSEAELPNDRG